MPAERNRQAILAAAREAFAQQGLDASLEDIARSAGVGSATLYRRFPTREDLIAAAAQQRVAAYADLVEQACVADDAWKGFCALLHAIRELQAADAGLSDLLTRTKRGAAPLGTQSQRAMSALDRLASRAKRQGKLRSDFSVEDVTMLFKANAGLILADGADRLTRTRFTNYVIDAFRTPGESRSRGGADRLVERSQHDGRDTPRPDRQQSPVDSLLPAKASRDVGGHCR